MASQKLPFICIGVAALLIFMVFAIFGNDKEGKDYPLYRKYKTDRSRLLCWILTTKNNFKTKAKAVKDTWSSRCDVTLFVASDKDDELNTTVFNITDSRSTLAQKTFAAFEYIYKHYSNDADWFLKADDDTYVIVENLRHLLTSYDPDQPWYFGHPMPCCPLPAKLPDKPYMSGGAGYVISKGALDKYHRLGVVEKRCPSTGTYEDADFGNCLHKVGVKIGKTEDEKKRTLFHPFHHVTMINGKDPNLPTWFYISRYPGLAGNKKGIDTLSRDTISWHYVDPGSMYLMHFLLYDLRRPKED